MTNALDHTYPTGGIPLYGTLGIDSFPYSEPRMFGFSAKYGFGGPSEEGPAPAADTPPPASAIALVESQLLFYQGLNLSLKPDRDGRRLSRDRCASSPSLVGRHVPIQS
jgi:hypothetical protein